MLRDALQGGVEANAVIWLAEQDGELQGLLGQEVSSLLEESATYLRIAAVARRFAGQGIGDAMVQHALDQARSDGLQAACAHTPPDNTPARALLYRNNFEELGEVRDGFQLWGRLLH
jgi:ribosomal protein S18 acetylase RimI-like enzyme